MTDNNAQAFTDVEAEDYLLDVLRELSEYTGFDWEIHLLESGVGYEYGFIHPQQDDRFNSVGISACLQDAARILDKMLWAATLGYHAGQRRAALLRRRGRGQEGL
jgi:hypothetical protein